MKKDRPITLRAASVPARKTSSYPAPFVNRVIGRSKRALGDAFGLRSFGVNLTTLEPGSQSSLRHKHQVQDEFVYVVDGEVTLVHDTGEELLKVGMCAGFLHGETAHHLVNRSTRSATYLEIGDRLPGDSANYPDDDLVAVTEHDGWKFTRKDGTLY